MNSDFVKNDCEYFTEYFNDLAHAQTFRKRDEYSLGMQDFDIRNHGLSEYGNFEHVIQTFDAGDFICQCVNHTRIKNVHFHCSLKVVVLTVNNIKS